jgi:hypothetical protein
MDGKTEPCTHYLESSIEGELVCQNCINEYIKKAKDLNSTVPKGT